MTSGRTDARRNRARLIEAARELFDEVGADAAAMNDVARRAGVGPGTLWRHFPNKEALLAEVVGQSLDDLAELAAELPRSEPENFLRRWVDALVQHIIRNRGLAASFMRAAEHGEGPLGTRCHAVERAAVDLLARAQELSKARKDLTAAELIRLATAVAWASETTEGDAARMLDILFEGVM